MNSDQIDLVLKRFEDPDEIRHLGADHYAK